VPAHCRAADREEEPIRLDRVLQEDRTRIVKLSRAATASVWTESAQQRLESEGVLRSSRQTPPRSGLYRIILAANLDQTAVPVGPGRNAGILIRHSLGFGIAPQIVWREIGDAYRFGESLNYVPNDLLAHTVPPDPVGYAYATKEFFGLDARGAHPFTQFPLDPVRDGNSPNMPALADEIYNRPMALPLLKVIESQFGDLMPPEAACKQQRE
jgi:hypothetical protein